jgi:uncharacterized membrane protein
MARDVQPNHKVVCLYPSRHSLWKGAPGTGQSVENEPNREEQNMATLTVLKFNRPDGAEKALNTLRRLQQQQLIELADAAVVEWPSDRKAPRTRQATDTAGIAELGGAFWGFLFGLIFFVPLLGFALGAATGALTGALTDVGIDDDFIRQTRDKVTPGTSALFVLATSAVLDRVIPELKPLEPELIATNLSSQEESRLRELFAEVATHA